MGRGDVWDGDAGTSKTGCSIDDVIVYGRNELWVTKKAHGQVSS